MTITEYIKERVEEHYVYKVIYLIAWKYAIVKEKDPFNGEWEMGNNGPKAIKYEDIEMTKEVKKYIDFTLEKTNRLKYTEFVHAYFNTYPAITTDRFCYFDIVKKAKEYKEYLKENKKKEYKEIVKEPRQE
jgi:hypothetical protein